MQPNSVCNVFPQPRNRQVRYDEDGAGTGKLEFMSRIYEFFVSVAEYQSVHDVSLQDNDMSQE